MADNLLKRPELAAQLESHGLTPGRARSQIEIFKKGVKPARLLRPCMPGDGIAAVAVRIDVLASVFERATEYRKVIKFVPASGAASRMFRQLLAARERGNALTREELRRKAAGGDGDSASVLRFIENIGGFAFYDSLEASLERDGLRLESLLDKGDYGEVVGHTTGPGGLDYASLPKGLVEFHRYPDGVRTAFEEHLSEACVYAASGPDRTAAVHFTVSPEHLERVRALVESVRPRYEKAGRGLEVEYSVQKPSTDTIAVDMDNAPFLDADGRLVLRPGGHGALLENLNELDCDIAFIKNIDNVVPERLRKDTYNYKKALGGLLVELQEGVARYMSAIDEGRADGAVLEEAAGFARSALGAELSEDFPDMPEASRAERLRSLFDRPLRVCGVVRNAGEPGGGPFWTEDADGGASRQIVESAQVDMDDPEQKAVWESSTHFNPVDIVCGLKDYRGRAFDLSRFSDPGASFISVKSKDGRELKALELPGLWNGAMAHWNSVFVEVPLSTFNPVKTVFDLLRPEHSS